MKSENNEMKIIWDGLHIIFFPCALKNVENTSEALLNVPVTMKRKQRK